MKKLLSVLLSLFSLTSIADSPTVRVHSSSYDNEGEYMRAKFNCLNKAYNLETKAIEITGDVNIRVRKLKMETSYQYNIVDCKIKFFDTSKTSFKLKKDYFNFKRCNNRHEEISQQANVVWSAYQNRVRTPDVRKGCVVYSVTAN